LADLSVEERQVFAESLKPLGVAELLQRMLRVLKTQDYIRRGIVLDALRTRFRQQESPEVDSAMESIRNILSDASMSVEEKRVLLEVLGRAETIPTLALLLESARALRGGELFDVAVRQIAQIGNDRWGGKFHEELSPLLENAWQHRSDDGRLEGALASAIAKIGAPNGVEVLVSELVGRFKSVDELTQASDSRTQASSKALRLVRNPQVLPLLERTFLQSGEDSVGEYVAGSTLAAMGQSDATRILLKWALVASDKDANVASIWFRQVRDTKSLAAIKNALENAHLDPFNSSRVQAVVADALRAKSD